MEPVITHRFVIKFNSNLGKVLRIGIPRARMDKTASEIEESMTALIDNGMIVSANRGVAASINGAKTITTTRTPFNI
ncbi:MAG: DUF2922 family protein [Defluviitaleaceae bacterium]|nr:DUF2922 family protein [Defluviitaleaceae bacterium]